MKTTRLFGLFLAGIVAATAVSCGGADRTSGGGESRGESVSASDEAGQKDMTLAENYDFGSPETWAGDSMTTLDLGDCILDAYPYDEKYDWGQSIMFDEDDGKYKMWWCRNSAYDTIWYAESEDMKHWSGARKILVVTEDSEWIKMHVGKPSVVKVDGVYYMYFEAPATLYNWKEFNNNVFRAVSRDGIDWEIDGKDGEPYPVLSMSDEKIAESIAFSEREGGSGYGYYGFGQPSVLYKDGLYYLYYTHTLEAGDRMYLTVSEDGVNFAEGKEVFLRAGSGVKYNELTGKFMFAYEYTEGRMSRIFYMESDDGYKFTYSNYIEASANKDVLSKGGGFVRGYPDFVGDCSGHVGTHTVYVSYMEGKMADVGNDWRQYASTWDIHIAAFNPKQFANRTMVLPNGRIYTRETVAPYNDAHRAYEDRLVGIPLINDAPTVDGVKDGIYSSFAECAVDRVSYAYRSVPGDISAKYYVAYNNSYLYVFVEVADDTKDKSDFAYVLLDEKNGAGTAADVACIYAYRDSYMVTDLEGNALSAGIAVAVKETDEGYNAEIKIPWRYLAEKKAYDSFGFDVYVYNDADSVEYKNILAWNDHNARCDLRYVGQLFFKK